jgi:hypothetical protein
MHCVAFHPLLLQNPEKAFATALLKGVDLEGPKPTKLKTDHCKYIAIVR